MTPSEYVTVLSLYVTGISFHGITIQLNLDHRSHIDMECFHKRSWLQVEKKVHINHFLSFLQDIEHFSSSICILFKSSIHSYRMGLG